MNREQYNSDTRYEKVWEQMKLLNIQDVTTNRQHRNGTIVWKLPIKNYNSGKTNIEVASFSTGYVRNQNSGYSNYQLNKRCESEPEYYKCTNKHDGSDLYRKYTTRTCRLIPIEIDRLEYLISYCLKNYYIKHANFVADGNYVPKWYHEYKYNQLADAAKLDYDCGHYDKIRDLEVRLEESDLKVIELQVDFDKNDCSHYERIRDLENKLDTIKRISDYA